MLQRAGAFVRGISESLEPNRRSEAHSSRKHFLLLTTGGVLEVCTDRSPTRLVDSPRAILGKVVMRAQMRRLSRFLFNRRALTLLASLTVCAMFSVSNAEEQSTSTPSRVDITTVPIPQKNRLNLRVFLHYRVCWNSIFAVLTSSCGDTMPL